MRGFQQTDCIDDTYFPETKMTTLKLLLVQNSSDGCWNNIFKGWSFVRTLCKTADWLWIWQFIIWPRSWCQCFDAFLTTLSFSEVNLIIVWMLKEKRSIESELSDKFKMKGFSNWKTNNIGIDIEYEYEQDNILTLSQKSDIDSLAKCYTIDNSKLSVTPMEINLKLEKS